MAKSGLPEPGLHPCPRCHRGQMYYEWDVDYLYWEVVCINCGARLVPVPAFKPPAKLKGNWGPRERRRMTVEAG